MNVQYSTEDVHQMRYVQILKGVLFVHVMKDILEMERIVLLVSFLLLLF